MKFLLPILLLAAILVSCDPGADRINAIDKEIRELSVQLKKRKANEVRLVKDRETVGANYQSVYDSDLDDAEKSKKLESIKKKMYSVEMRLQKSLIETTKGETQMIRLKLEKMRLKNER